MLFATLLLWLEYAGIVLAVLSLTAWLGRRLPAKIFLVCALLPVIFLFPAFALNRTPLPLDHAMNLAPWASLPHELPRNANLNDIATQMLPWNKAVRLAAKEGALPWLDRWNGCGTPLAANGQSSPFSPLTLIGLTLPMVAAFALAAAVKLFLCLAGTWLWLRELKISPAAALFGAVCFSFSLTMTPWLFFPHTVVICLWPWALLAIELTRDGGASRRAFVLLCATFAVWPLLGHLESVMLGAAFTAFWLCLRWAAGDLPEAPRLGVRIAAAAAIALGLSAFALAPQALAILASDRFVLARRPFWSGAFSWRPHGPLWRTSLFTSLFPRSLGDGIASPMIGGTAGSFPEMALAYFGIAGWATALLIARPGSPRRREEWAMVIPAAFGWGAAIALWPFVEIAGAIPALKIMFPLRFLSWTALAGSAVAAFEIDRLAKDRQRRPRAPAALCLTSLALAGLAVFAYFHFRSGHAAAGGLQSQGRALSVSLATLALAAVAGLLCAVPGRGAILRAWPAVLTAAAAAELLYQGARLYRYESPALLFPETPVIRFLRERAGLFRVVGSGMVLFPNSSVFAGVEDVRTHDAVERRDYVEFLDATCGYDPKEYFKSLVDLNAPALDFLNVRFLLSRPGSAAPGPKWKPVYGGTDAAVFENAEVLPRVFVPRATRRIPDARSPGPFGRANANESFGAAFREITAQRVWTETALLLGPASPPQSGAPVANGEAAIDRLHQETNTFGFRSIVPEGGAPAIAVASLVNDGGWSASDERGEALTVVSANGPFLGVALPSGEHAVTLRYRPPGLAAGTVISGAACVAIVALTVLRRRRKATTL